MISIVNNNVQVIQISHRQSFAYILLHFSQGSKYTDVLGSKLNTADLISNFRALYKKEYDILILNDKSMLPVGIIFVTVVLNPSTHTTAPWGQCSLTKIVSLRSRVVQPNKPPLSSRNLGPIHVNDGIIQCHIPIHLVHRSRSSYRNNPVTVSSNCTSKPAFTKCDHFRTCAVQFNQIFPSRRENLLTNKRKINWFSVNLLNLVSSFNWT